MNLRFEVDQYVAQAGEMLSGKLVINTSSAYKASHLALYFRGKEYTSVKYTSSSGKNSTTNTAHGVHQIMRVNLPCQTDRIIQHGKLLAGNHNIPFRFQIPTGIPSSMNVEARDSAKIVYCLRAVLIGSGIFKDYQCRQEIKILAQGESVRTVPALIPPRWQKITSFGFIKKGDMSFGVKCMDTHLNPGQKVPLKVALVNDSMAALNKVEIKLRQVTHMKAGGHSQQNSQILSSSQHPQPRPTSVMDKSSLKASRKNKISRRQERIHKLYTILNASENEQCCELNIPLNIDNTYQGVNITVKHDICVRLVTDGGFTNPEVYIPVKIARAAATPNESPVAAAAAPIPMAEAFPAYPITAETEPIYDLDNNEYTIYPPADENLEYSKLPPPMNPAYGNQLPNADDIGQSPSVQQLLQKMNQSVDDLSIVEHRVLRQSSSPEWCSIFANLSPQEYGLILEQVDLDVNVVPVATLLALHCAMFTCEHVSAALPHAGSTVRTTMVEQLFPYCADLEENYALIFSMLSEWDQMVTRSALQAALQRKSSN